jgi:hypothetical protein
VVTPLKLSPVIPEKKLRVPIHAQIRFLQRKEMFQKDTLIIELSALRIGKGSV